ncbi:MAG TPA: DUF5666 domain-containing protein [Candidatus Sulfotelmatobacter sp.]|nr:DUF5666 domain-containing protein [Candidatus Sulfotelmatobacter sp.]
MKIAFACLTLGGLLLSSSAYAQASADPATSAMVTPKSDPSSDPNIEPAKPSIAEESADPSIAVDPASLLPDLPPVPKANATLIGGTVEKLDRVRDRVIVRPFGGGKMTILFDPRTVVYHGEKEGTVADLQEGQRIYLDTILDGNTVFARAIRLNAPQATGESQGVVLKYRSDRDQLTIRDAMSPKPINIRVTSATKFLQGDRPVPASTLVPGTLVSISFATEGDGHTTASQISLLATPGTRYTFTGQVLHIDLRSGLLVLNSSTDHKTYEVYLDPSINPDENLHPGVTVTVVTNFDGSRYLARNMTINSQQ